MSQCHSLPHWHWFRMSDLNKAKVKRTKNQTQKRNTLKFMWQTLIFQFGASFACDKMTKYHAIETWNSKTCSIFHGKAFVIRVVSGSSWMTETLSITFLDFPSSLLLSQAYRQQAISHRAIRITWAVIYHHKQALRLANRYSFETFHDSMSVFTFPSASLCFPPLLRKSSWVTSRFVEDFKLNFFTVV